MGLGIGLYVRNSFEAVETYRKAFGLELGYYVLNEDNKGYYHSELMKNGEPFISVVDSNAVPVNNPVQLGYEFHTRTELENAYKLLKTDGIVKMDVCELPWSPCATVVIDKFGIEWYLSLPGYRPNADFKPSDFKISE